MILTAAEYVEWCHCYFGAAAANAYGYGADGLMGWRRRFGSCC
jgi:hypothetical protein